MNIKVIKILYRKNLKLSPQKIAAACTHIGVTLGDDIKGIPIKERKVIVLMASDKKFIEKIEELKSNDMNYHVHIDIGLTEVERGTAVAVGWCEEDK